jgi:peroxiredoxin
MQTKIIALLLVVALFTQCKNNPQQNTGAKDDQEASTLTKVGQQAPGFSFQTLAGDNKQLTDYKSKVVLLNFFATWCGSCMKEMPALEAEIWQKHKDDNFVVLAFGREHTAEEMQAFIDKKGYTFPVYPDPDRSIYALYAEKYIPRNILLDTTGKIVYQCSGYTEEDFNELKGHIESLLK